MRTVTLFTRRNCHLCDVAREVIDRVGRDIPFVLEITDIDEPENDHWLDAYDYHVPVIHVDGREVARHRLEPQQLKDALLPGL